MTAEQKTTTPSKVNVATLMVALLSACVAFQLNASMLSPALATIQRELHTDAASVGLTQTAFFTSAALFSLFLPRLGDNVGRKRVLTGMLVVMGVGCAVAALAPNIGVLFVGRVIQGVSGPVVPLCLIMLRVEVRDPKLYGTLMGVLTAINGGIAGVDALGGGYLAEHHGFGAVFWTMAVVAGLAALSMLFFSRESTAEKTERMDWLGVLLIVISVGALLVALDELGKLAAANWVLVIVLLVVTAVAFWLFWRVEDRGQHPLVATHLLRRRATWSLLLTTLLTMTGVFAVMNGLIPNLAQDSSGGYRMAAGVAALWTLTPYALAGLLMGPLSGWMAATFGYRRILRIGMAGSVATIALMMLVVGSSSRLLLLAVSLLLGITYAGIGNIILNGLGIVLSPKENQGFLPGLNAGAFNLGAGLSFAVIFGVETATGGANGTGPSGYYGGLTAGLVILLLALAASFLIPRPVGAELGAPERTPA
ncbi:MAG TPA: MFS transporter [Segeticoccus sp.]|uniref:uridine transporter UriT n=1 Tax=Segeticoccus sp. TaxID=2706531 RepID=UPI002D7EBCBE|nr:MFS transporter [Segeticoccus sp.]HET8602237.1 MFS transporter [Segeticoccus sp.]